MVIREIKKDIKKDFYGNVKETDRSIRVDWNKIGINNCKVVTPKVIISIVYRKSKKVMKKTKGKVFILQTVIWENVILVYKVVTIMSKEKINEVEVFYKTRFRYFEL